jgi:hypothetical protein
MLQILLEKASDSREAQRIRERLKQSYSPLVAVARENGSVFP